MASYDIAERIRLGVQASNRSATDIAKALGFSKQNFQRFLSSPPERSKHLPKIAETLGCDLQWLITGNGKAPSWSTAPPVSKENDAKIRHLETLVEALTDKVQSLQEENAGLKAVLSPKKRSS